ncbi:MAG: endonuclease domain-containing protein [Candidatus Peregrinibacteria bacterium]
MNVTDTTKRQRFRKLTYARRLRKRMTRAESVLWGALRGRKCAQLKFRRQAPLEWFVVDFFCIEKSLAIEIDGGVHVTQADYDREREEILRQKRIRVLRFTNDEVLNDLSAVLSEIRHASVTPSPRG